MMVLGHEHFAHRDHLRQLGRGILTQIVLTSLFGDTSGLERAAVSGTAALTDAGYSQSQEYRADEFGLTLLQHTYGQVAGATDFFARISQPGESLDFLATHPGSAQRIERLKATSLATSCLCQKRSGRRNNKVQRQSDFLHTSYMICCPKAAY